MFWKIMFVNSFCTCMCNPTLPRIISVYVNKSRRLLSVHTRQTKYLISAKEPSLIIFTTSIDYLQVLWLSSNPWRVCDINLIKRETNCLHQVGALSYHSDDERFPWDTPLFTQALDILINSVKSSLPYLINKTPILLLAWLISSMLNEKQEPELNYTCHTPSTHLSLSLIKLPAK